MSSTCARRHQVHTTLCASSRKTSGLGSSAGHGDRPVDPCARRIRAGRGRIVDLDLLLEIGDTIGIIPGTTICGLADGAAWPLKNAIRKFRDEFEEHIKRTNPNGWDNTEPVPSIDLAALHSIH